MRMYLSSFDLGNASSELAGLAPTGRTALIMNALDNRPEGRERWRAGQSQKLEALGLTVSDLDLRDFFGAPDRLRERLRRYERSNIPYKTLRDGEVFIVRGGLDSMEKLGSAA